MCGFSNENYFARLFTNVFQIAPSELRNCAIGDLPRTDCTRYSFSAGCSAGNDTKNLHLHPSCVIL